MIQIFPPHSQYLKSTFDTKTIRQIAERIYFAFCRKSKPEPRKWTERHSDGFPSWHIFGTVPSISIIVENYALWWKTTRQTWKFIHWRTEWGSHGEIWRFPYANSNDLCCWSESLLFVLYHLESLFACCEETAKSRSDCVGAQNAWIFSIGIIFFLYICPLGSTGCMQ